ncbi:hypothetical protein [Bordetella flabilis]|uniref:Uncharacterized protein n=1 Tax=Bordetella flabilis TaxID=463014 RepID=A0A193G9Z4_9BORD|nr:hypothetical protein [Bordetella flabilis]ANN76812.1 hypothetical protein BAU07_06515 [Bordetella flabilis]
MAKYAIAAAAGLALALAAVFGVKWYGHTQYAAGHAQAQLEAQAAAAELAEKYRAQEQAWAQQMEAERAQDAIDRQKAAADLAGQRLVADSLRGQLAAGARRAAAEARAAGRDVATAQAPWLVLEECRREYDALAADAESINDDFRAVQGWGRVTQGSDDAR